MLVALFRTINQMQKEYNLADLPETILPLKELKPYIGEDGNAMAFEEGNNIMLLALHNEVLMKKRVNKKHFNGSIEDDSR